MSVSEAPIFAIDDSRSVLEVVPGNMGTSSTHKSNLEERDGEVRCRIANETRIAVGRVNIYRGSTLEPVNLMVLTGAEERASLNGCARCSDRQCTLYTLATMYYCSLWLDHME